eukprot:CAMPEP_0113891208 /NCGR_PEP_ID=MMETSP0780_2-20120614/14620_1 /TAXON_ID=652834 /ORGANISM="Palpitomonas bilix" /LENGTH=133 /DNA_ID=CAMNT_0000880783 /DNA_START=331 /DNA_END=732 /DNA_ORIENTATION=+ /assembly_acc=CAM_ASM_000599
MSNSQPQFSNLFPEISAEGRHSNVKNNIAFVNESLPMKNELEKRHHNCIDSIEAKQPQGTLPPENFSTRANRYVSRVAEEYGSVISSNEVPASPKISLYKPSHVRPTSRSHSSSSLPHVLLLRPSSTAYGNLN